MNQLIDHYQAQVTENIPLTEYMTWKILAITPVEIKTICDLAPNINVHGTAYAGSIYAAGMATGWTLAKCWHDDFLKTLKNEGHQLKHASLVAAEANIKYLSPVDSNFTSYCALDSELSTINKLKDRLNKNRSCGLKLEVKIHSTTKCCAIMNIQFVFKV